MESAVPLSSRTLARAETYDAAKVIVVQKQGLLVARDLYGLSGIGLPGAVYLGNGRDFRAAFSG